MNRVDHAAFELSRFVGFDAPCLHNSFVCKQFWYSFVYILPQDSAKTETIKTNLSTVSINYKWTYSRVDRKCHLRSYYRTLQ